ncbi:hypothetical protein EBQ74_00125 [bacterium]|nr:hypothetical protein [bacterium]
MSSREVPGWVEVFVGLGILSGEMLRWVEQYLKKAFCNCDECSSSACFFSN